MKYYDLKRKLAEKLEDIKDMQYFTTYEQRMDDYFYNRKVCQADKLAGQIQDLIEQFASEPYGK